MGHPPRQRPCRRRDAACHPQAVLDRFRGAFSRFYPPPSTLTSVNFACFPVLVSMMETSLFMAGPPPKSDSPRLRVQALGVGMWVFAAKARGVKADARRTADARRPRTGSLGAWALLRFHEKWTEKSPIHLAAYVMWRLNWIYPFTDGHGRTFRAISCLVLCIRLRAWLPGRLTLPEQVEQERTPYCKALGAADDA